MQLNDQDMCQLWWTEEEKMAYYWISEYLLDLLQHNKWIIIRFTIMRDSIWFGDKYEDMDRDFYNFLE